MIYFTYKLNGGMQPYPLGKAGETQVKTCFSRKDGVFVGMSVQELRAVFSEKVILDHEITEIASSAALALADGFNEAGLDANGAIVDLNPAYLENRGIKYVQALEVKAASIVSQHVKAT